MRILITGATGLIGREIGKRLAEKNHQIYVISRNCQKALLQLPFPAQVIEGDLSRAPIEDARLREVEAVIHLAGEPVAGGRWSKKRKQEIERSRVQGTENLRRSLAENLQVIVAASGVGFYGDGEEDELSEESCAGKDFLAQVCVNWEKAVQNFSCRKLIFRTGMVLSPQGGALEKMLFPFRAGVGGRIANGLQWMSWVDLQDLVNMYLWGLENKNAEGIYNAVSPFPARNREFSRLLARALKRPLFFSIPKSALKVAFGEFAGVLCASQKASANKLLRQGFVFQCAVLEESLKKICESVHQEEVFSTEQYIAAKPEEVFSFFSDPCRLETINPPALHLRLRSPATGPLQEGSSLEYKLDFPYWPVGGRAEVQCWKPYEGVAVVRGKGIYWRYIYGLRAFAGGTLLQEQVQYRLPGLTLAGWS